MPLPRRLILRLLRWAVAGPADGLPPDALAARVAVLEEENHRLRTDLRDRTAGEQSAIAEAKIYRAKLDRVYQGELKQVAALLYEQELAARGLQDVKALDALTQKPRK